MKISVALCTYNGERFLEEQLKSIFSQTLPVHEVVICDDASSDNTVEIINKFILQYPNIITLHINKVPLKTIKNFEKAVSLTTGDYIFLSDQDDVWMPWKVEKMMGKMNQLPNALLLFTNGDLIDDFGNPLQSTLWDEWGFDQEAKLRWAEMKLAFTNLLYNKNYVTGATVLFKKKLKENSLPIDLPNGYYHDTWFAMHAAAKGGLFYIDESLIKYRIHSSQQVGITAGNENGQAVFSNTNISLEDYVAKMYRKFPSQKPKESLILKFKIYVYNLLHKK